MVKTYTLRKTIPKASQIESILGLPAGSVQVSVEVSSYSVSIMVPDSVTPTVQQRQDVAAYIKQCLAYDLIKEETTT